MEDDRYYSEPFNRVAAWVDLLLMANVKDSVVYIRGVEVKVKRGQVAISERDLEKRWKISRTKVRRFLSEFESENKIEPQKNHRTHLISILNYDKYQTSEPQKNHRKTTEKPVLKEKEIFPPAPLIDKKKTPTKVGAKERKENTLTGVKEKVAADAATLTQGRRQAFYNTLVPYVEKYGKDMVREFFDYWSEENRSHTKMRFEQQPTWEVGKRLATWARNDKKYQRNGNRNSQTADRMAKLADILTD